MRSKRLPRGRASRASVVTNAVRFVQPLEPRRLMAAGDLDTTFGGNGGVLVDFTGTGVGVGADFASAVVVQPDGRIILAGNSGSGGNTDDKIALARLNPDGSLDTTFDGDGRVILPNAVPGDID